MSEWPLCNAQCDGIELSFVLCLSICPGNEKDFGDGQMSSCDDACSGVDFSTPWTFAFEPWSIRSQATFLGVHAPKPDVVGGENASMR